MCVFVSVLLFLVVVVVVVYQKLRLICKFKCLELTTREVLEMKAPK